MSTYEDKRADQSPIHEEWAASLRATLLDYQESPPPGVRAAVLSEVRHRRQRSLARVRYAWGLGGAVAVLLAGILLLITPQDQSLREDHEWVSLLQDRSLSKEAVGGDRSHAVQPDIPSSPMAPLRSSTGEIADEQSQAARAADFGEKEWSLSPSQPEQRPQGVDVAAQHPPMGVGTDEPAQTATDTVSTGSIISVYSAPSAVPSGSSAVLSGSSAVPSGSSAVLSGSSAVLSGSSAVLSSTAHRRSPSADMLWSHVQRGRSSSELSLYASNAPIMQDGRLAGYGTHYPHAAQPMLAPMSKVSSDFSDEVAQVTRTAETEVSYRSDPPITIGGVLTYPIGYRWALEAGLQATRYGGRVTTGTSNISTTQSWSSLVVGVPIGVQYHLLPRSPLSLYVSAGVALSYYFPMTAELVHTSSGVGRRMPRSSIRDQRESGWLLSLQGGIGVSYALSTSTALFVRPGVVWFPSSEQFHEATGLQSTIVPSLSVGLTFGL